MVQRPAIPPRPRTLVATAIAVILVFAFLYPMTGHIEDLMLPEGNRAIGYLVSTPLDAPGYYATVVFPKSLYLSVTTFTLVGSNQVGAVGPARFLVALESMLGVAFLALLVASLVPEPRVE